MSLIPYNFDGKPVRTITRDGEPWFVLADVCKVLEIANPSNVSHRLEDDEKHTLRIMEGIAGPQVQSLTIISESGLYSLIMVSRKPDAKRFRKWVTSEVIPAIRRDGGYMVAKAEETPEELALRAMKVLQTTIDRQKSQLDVALPKAEALDRIATADGALSVTEAAKALQVRPKDLFSYMQSHDWAYRRSGSGTWLGKAPRTNSGDVTHKVATIKNPDGTDRIVEQLKITPKGLAKLAKGMQVDMGNVMQ
jgi:prophage antirepressor-like protein